MYWACVSPGQDFRRTFEHRETKVQEELIASVEPGKGVESSDGDLSLLTGERIFQMLVCVGLTF